MRKRLPTFPAGFEKVAAGFRPGIAYALLLAFGLQAGAPAWAWEPSRPPASAESVSPASSIPSIPSIPSDPPAASAPSPALNLGGPGVPEFNAAFPNRPGRAVQKVDPVTFSRYVNSHSGQGRLLTGAALTAVVAAAGSPAVETTPVKPEVAKPAKPKMAAEALRLSCDTMPTESRPRCRDSVAYLDTVASSHAPKALREMQERDAVRRDSLARDDRTDHARVDDNPDDSEDQRYHNWFVNIFADAREGGGGGGGWDSDDWAAVIYVVIGVVVVGAFVIYGVQMLGEMAMNQEGYPLFMEAGARLSYSGKSIEDQQGVGELYRDAYLAGLRFAIGLDRPGMGIGLTAEGGYIDVFLRSASDPARTFDFKGGYLVAGPMIRFGDNDPWSFSLEFLNGTSTHESIGWISKSRMTLQAKVSEHLLVGGHLGAVFYDLHFFDGLGLREGNFNRDLSLVWGLDTGWEF
jgi:hypothetical protein